VRHVQLSIQAPELKDSASAKSIAARHEGWRADMPTDEAALWDWLVALDEASRLALLAHCVSFGVNALFEKADRYGGPGITTHGLQRRLDQADRLARAVGLDMAEAGWRPTVDNYLGRVTKGRILDAVREARGEYSAQLIGRVGMKRLTLLPRQVSSSPSPNRTCKFPRIRLSMHGTRHGWLSKKFESVESRPELIGPTLEPFIWRGIPSVRYPYASAWKAGCPTFQEKAELLRAIGPHPPFTSLARETTAHAFPRGMAAFVAQPTSDSLPHPPVERVECSTGSRGVAVVVTPTGNDGIEFADQMGERFARRRSSHQTFDLVAQVVELAFRNEELAYVGACVARLFLNHPISEEIKAFLDISDRGLLHRQLHAEFLFEEIRQRLALILRLFPCSLYHDDEIISIAGHVECRPSFVPVFSPAVGRPQ
jgi:hypothetical protein